MSHVPEVLKAMKAVRLHHTGGPEVLQLDEIERPGITSGQVLVKAHSIGVGIADQLVRNGQYPWMPKLPTIPGIEMSGWIEAVGDGVTGHKVGDPVVVSAVPERGCYAEYMAVDADWAFPCRSDIDLADAACLTNYRVAYRILHTAARVRAGESVVIVGAAGGLGSALVQLANDAGLVTIALIRGEEKAAFAGAMGADHVIDSRREDAGARIMEITDGQGANLFIDPVGGDGFVGQLDLLAPVGMLVLYGLIEGFPADDVFRAQCERMGRSPAVRMFSIHSYDHNPDDTAADLALLMKMIADERIKPAIYAKLPLGSGGEAHAQLENGKVLGKIVLQPGLTEA
jgi:NADPH2:quinone reductase